MVSLNLLLSGRYLDTRILFNNINSSSNNIEWLLPAIIYSDIIQSISYYTNSWLFWTYPRYQTRTFCEISVENLRRARHADRGHLLQRILGLVPFEAYILHIHAYAFNIKGTWTHSHTKRCGLRLFDIALQCKSYVRVRHDEVYLCSLWST